MRPDRVLNPGPLDHEADGENEQIKTKRLLNHASLDITNNKINEQQRKLSLRNIAEKKLKQEYSVWKGNQNKNISFYRLNISFIQHNAGLQLVDFITNGRPGIY